MASRFINFADCNIRPVLFLRASDKEIVAKQKVVNSNHVSPTTHLSGDDAKSFYDSLIAEPSTAASSEYDERTVQVESPPATVDELSQRTKRGSGKFRHSERLVNAFLRNAQNGDLDELKKCLEKGCDIDALDRFSWTALMCASHSGQVEIVHHLLQHGADRTVTNSQGQRAAGLAEIAGYQNVVHLLTFFDRDKIVRHKKSREHGDKHGKHFWCDVCKNDFPEVNRREHRHSTVHLFNTKHKILPTQYFIPENNVGFQMMVKKGWDRDHGLGPEGSGQKYPIKTVLKRDRQGLGSDKTKKARVTHFKPNDIDAVRRPKPEKEMRLATINRKARERIDKKTKNWERNMRIYFNS